jgi:hypothetical protein
MKFFYQQDIANNKRLLGFGIRCTTNTTYKVKDANKTLCGCGSIVAQRKMSFLLCPDDAIILLNFSVVLSVQNISNDLAENCTFKFYFNDLARGRTSLTTFYIKRTVFLPSIAYHTDQGSTTSPFIATTSLAATNRYVVY